MEELLPEPEEDDESIADNSDDGDDAVDEEHQGYHQEWRQREVCPEAWDDLDKNLTHIYFWAPYTSASSHQELPPNKAASSSLPNREWREQFTQEEGNTKEILTEPWSC